MANKKISELDQTLNLNDQADFPLSQDNGGEPTTFKAKLTQIATKIAEAITFSNLKTGNKQLVSAVNQTISNLADDFNTTAGSTYAKDDCVLYNGVLYQCNNSSGTTSGTFIDADWTAIKAVDVGSGGGGGSSTFAGLSDVSINDQTLTNGQVPVYNSVTHKWENGNASGGSGGHTILDDSGTALTQRSNMQFKGAYSEDNSTDEITEVNVIRSMTKAEFDALLASEKQGIINITDITDGDDDRFQPVIYSEEEREIGVWIDGKPLYEKTFIFTTSASVSANSWGDTPISNDGIEKTIYCVAYDIATGTSYDYLACGKGSGSYVRILNVRNAALSYDGLTLRYTKTTDQAGSGQWTPQGVPAVHYSTDEQVVGTWIDGSTIYEKGLTASGPFGDTFNYIPHGVSNFNQLLDYFGYCTYGSSDKMNIPSLRGSSYVTISSWDATNIRLERANLSSAISDVNLVIRYTKSST